MDELDEPRNAIDPLCIVVCPKYSRALALKMVIYP